MFVSPYEYYKYPPCPQFGSLLEQYETHSSPRMTLLALFRQLLDVPNSFGGYYLESVDTPVLLTYSKPLASCTRESYLFQWFSSSQDGPCHRGYGKFWPPSTLAHTYIAHSSHLFTTS